MENLQQIICVGIDHTTTDRPLRLIAAMDDPWSIGTMRRMRLIPGVTDALALSTCNRVEFYAAVDADHDAQLAAESVKQLLVDYVAHKSAGLQSKFMTVLVPDEKLMDEIGLFGDERPKPIDRADAREACDKQARLVELDTMIRTGDAAIERLVRTAMGLTSGVIGDTKIHEQLQYAHRRALRSGHLNSQSRLDSLLRTAIDTARPVRSHDYATSSNWSSRGAVAGSIAGLDIQAMRSNMNHRARVVIIGSNSEARAAALNVINYGCSLGICASSTIGAYLVGTDAKRARPGREHVVPLDVIAADDLHAHGLVDVIIVADVVDEAYLSVKQIKRICKNRRAEHKKPGYEVNFSGITVIDLTDGAGIDPAAAKLNDVGWFNTEDIDHHFGTSMRSSQKAIAAAEAAYEDAMDEHRAWTIEQQIAGEIKRACLALDMQAQTEIRLIDPSLTGSERAQLEREIMQRAAAIKHDCVNELRQEAGLPTRSRSHSHARTLARALAVAC